MFTDLKAIYQLNLNHQQAIDQLNQQGEVNGLQTKFGFKSKQMGLSNIKNYLVFFNSTILYTYSELFKVSD